MQHLIQTRGFNAISYQDIADEVGIRKASIHHHFRTKFDLGRAVIERYRHQAREMIGAASSLTPTEQLTAYFGPYRMFSETDDMVCLCGALAGEFLALPSAMRDEVRRFFDEHQKWLEMVLRAGKDSGEFTLAGDPREEARLFFSALQGALLVKRTSGDVNQIESVIAGLMRRIILPDPSLEEKKGG